MPPGCSFARLAQCISPLNLLRLTGAVPNRKVWGPEPAAASYVAHDFLEWFAREQLEEVSTMDTLLKMVQRTGESGLIDVENAVAAGRVHRKVGGVDEGH